MSKQGKQTVNSKALSMFVGSRLMPGRDGRPQRKLSEKDAYEKAKKWNEERRANGR